ncbi:DNA-directed RNA polymerase III subunit RPC4 [Rhynchospora pubera]|uniref:DNA-directed RNA polymerase III subunit RPC4 n=1 Tax=Rhynchospora pubera TaxID=906938 RepID=A0AAV8H6K7_9POAL|nr:DNA-directed RNA polymerase III subunit RPC4 [Rhynchospora pubera]
MAERAKNSPSSSRVKQKFKFTPKAPISKVKKARSRSSVQQETEDRPVIDEEVMKRLRPRQAVRKIAIGRDETDSADQKPQSSSQACARSKDKKEKNYGPSIVLPLRPDNSNLEKQNKKEFGQTSLTSAELEASVNPAKYLGLEKESEQERMLLFKFPNPLPLENLAQTAEVTEKKGKTKAKKIGCSLQQLPAGNVGKMLVYKSGKVKMKIGEVIFNVDPGVNYIFHEQAVAINAKQGHVCEIGKIDEQHVVVTPDIGALLEGSKK